MKPKFEIPKEKKEEMADLIQEYFREERDEDIGHLAAMLLVDFISEKLAPTFYNLGVEDAHAYMSAKLDDIFEIQK